MADEKTTDKKLHLKIITHEKIVYENNVDAVYSPGMNGEFGIVYGHIPFMTILKIGITRILNNGDWESVSTLGGIFRVQDNKITILADEAEKGCDIDIPRAKLAKERAEARLGTTKDRKERARAEKAIARAIARLKAANINS